jgi:KipI family sensor histidine kinase inhibitor
VRVRQVGATALLLEVDDPPGWFEELWRRRRAGELPAMEIVPGARTVLVDGLADPQGALELIRRWAPRPVSPSAARPVVEIPVEYEGEDLPDVARLWHTSEQGVIDRLSETELRVAFCGFSPGWAYLSGLPEELAVPRLDTPRPKVPAGSVALGGPYAGIYPNPSPGGWRLVGTTGVTLFDPDRNPPALLTPGTRVRLIELSYGPDRRGLS